MQLRRDEIGGRARPAGKMLRIVIPACRQFDRGQDNERARTQAQRLVRVAAKESQRRPRRGAERQSAGHRRSRRRRARGRAHIDRRE